MIFYKYEATQNDFILTLDKEFNKTQIKDLCNVHKKIGADGLININNLKEVTIYNQDGSKANMCGNGLRCVAHLLHRLTNKDKHTVIVNNKEYEITYLDDNNAMVKIDVPIFINKKSNLSDGYYVDTNNLHFVMLVNNLESFKFDDRIIDFSKNNHCNVEIITIISNNEFKMRVYEYGVGETSSCGSGAIASFYVLRKFNLISENASCILKGGTLKLVDKNDYFLLNGNVNLVYKGELIDEL